MKISIDHLSQKIKHEIERYENSVLEALNSGNETEAKTLVDGFDDFIKDSLLLFESLTEINITDFCRSISAN